MNDRKNAIIRLIKAIVIFVIVVVVSAFIFATAMYFLEKGYEYAPLFATLCMAAGSFTASWYLGVTIGKKGIIIGTLSGGVVFIVTALITLLVNSGAVTLHLLLRFVILILTSVIGAIIGVNKNNNKKFV